MQLQAIDISAESEFHTLRLDYNNGLIYTVRWIYGTINPASSQTKPRAGYKNLIIEYMLTQDKQSILMF